MRKPRIAFIIDQWRPGSGTENQLVGMLAHLVPDHIDAHLFTLRIPLSEQHRDLFPCPVDCLGVGRLVSLGAVLKLPGIISQLRRGNFDVAMIYFVDSNLYMVPACRLAGIPSVVINRRDMGYWYRPWLLQKLNFVNRWATHFLVNADAVREQVVLHECFPHDRIRVIPNGVWGPGSRREICSEGEQDLPAGFPKSGPVVGITASLRDVKRLDRFLEMAAAVIVRVPEARFVIAGQGPMLEDLKILARKLGVHEAVVFLGQVASVPSLLNNIQVGVLTSESEGLSNSLVEYGLSGVPTVTYAVGGNGEVVRDGETGFLVPSGDSSAFAERVVRLLCDKGLRKQMGLAACAYCEGMFGKERITGLTMDYFDSLIENSGGGGD